MRFYAVSSLSDLRPGPYHLMEPEPKGEEILPEKGDLILVPCLVFAGSGDRLGYGGGFYDRWLAAHPEGQAVLAAFSMQEDSFETQAHDIPAAWIATENGIARGGSR